MMGSGCRSCKSTSLQQVLDRGELPLAGDFQPLGTPNRVYPLSIDVCGSCGLLQVRETLESSVIFGPQYSYSSSTVPALVDHFRSWAADVTLPRGAGKRLLEIGCNDGVFLAPLKAAGYDVVGVDASDNVAGMARAKGLSVKTGLFDRSLAGQLFSEYGAFDVVTCSNVFAHNPRVNDFVAAVSGLLAREGEFWIEVHSAHSLHSALQWDCFYHEHCFYWTLQSLSACLERHGFLLKSYALTPMHGGAIRAVFGREGERARISEPALSVDDWMQFAEKSLRSRETLSRVIPALPIRYGYGAAGRAVVLINWAGLASQLEFVVDGSPLRHGRAIPGTRVPVISEEQFFQTSEPSEWCFVTAHNYLDGIRQKVQSRRGHRRTLFVTPLPNVRIG